MGYGPLCCLRAGAMGRSISLVVEFGLDVLGFGEFRMERVVLEPKALNLLWGAAADEEPRAVDGCCHERAGQYIGTLGKDAGALGILEGKHQLRVAVAHDGTGACLAIERVELGKQLAKQITPAFHDDAAKAEQDASTQALIEFYRAHRK